MPRKLGKHLCFLCGGPTRLGNYVYKGGWYYHRKCIFKHFRHGRPVKVEPRLV